MPRQFSPDVEEQLKECMAAGRYRSEDDVLRDALKALRHRNDELVALKDAIADLEAGDRGMPFDEFIDEFRRKRGIA
jgi:putative addiction module CopG family antidote